jgi:hypothetical protein
MHEMKDPIDITRSKALSLRNDLFRVGLNAKSVAAKAVALTLTNTIRAWEGDNIIIPPGLQESIEIYIPHAFAPLEPTKTKRRKTSKDKELATTAA